MNLKQLGILLVIVVIVAGAGLMLRNHQNASWTSSDAEVGKKLLGDFPFNDVARISIRHGTNELDLEKKNDLWRVRERGDYPANFPQISEFLLKLRDLKIVQSEKAGPAELTRLELAPGQGTNSATVVEFADQSDKPIRTLLVGKKHMKKSAAPSQFEGEEGFADGRFVKAGTNSPNVALISDPLDNVDAAPPQWLSKDFIHVEKPKSIEAIFPIATNSWKLTRPSESGEWKLTDARTGEELDSSKTSGVTTPFSSANFTDVLPQSKSDQLGTNKPTVVKIETFDDFAYTFNIGAKTNDDYLVTISITANFPARPIGVNEKPEDKPKIDKIYNDAQQKLKDKFEQEQACENWTYLMPSWEVDSLLKGRSELLAEKKEEPKKEESKPSTGNPSEKSTETNQPQSAKPAAP
ncbi:MAG TPA: DUF4340 domain-containing protein [Verrucomicrobiae bacterium]|jgi:hypothetical protein